MRSVIIGNGVAGINAAEAVRSLDSEAEITIIAGESFPPYCRPMISMALEGTVSHDALAIRPPSFYDKLRIRALIGERAESIDLAKRAVITGGGTVVPFDKLLIATGADPRAARGERADLKNIFPMRTETHVKGMLDALKEVKHALVLGGGLVGFKAAHGLLARGIPVTMLIRSGYPLSMQVDRPAGEMILKELQARGLEVHVGVEVERFEGNGAVSGALLSDGSHRECQLVVVGKGVYPAVSFLPPEIEVDLGIVVDERLQTRVDGVYAAGDVAESFDVARQTRWVNAIWPVAAEQGRVAGMNMAGRPVSYRGSLSRNVIRIFGLDVMTAGLVNPPDEREYEVVSRIDPARKTYRKIVFRGDIPVGMVLVNDIEQGGVIMNMIHSRAALMGPRDRLLDRSFNVKQLML